MVYGKIKFCSLAFFLLGILTLGPLSEYAYAEEDSSIYTEIELVNQSAQDIAFNPQASQQTGKNTIPWAVLLRAGKHFFTKTSTFYNSRPYRDIDPVGHSDSGEIVYGNCHFKWKTAVFKGEEFHYSSYGWHYTFSAEPQNQCRVKAVPLDNALRDGFEMGGNYEGRIRFTILNADATKR